MFPLNVIQFNDVKTNDEELLTSNDGIIGKLIVDTTTLVFVAFGKNAEVILQAKLSNKKLNLSGNIKASYEKKQAVFIVKESFCT